MESLRLSCNADTFYTEEVRRIVAAESAAATCALGVQGEL